MSKLDYSDIGYVEIRYLEMQRQIDCVDEKIESLSSAIESLINAINKLAALVGGETIDLSGTLSNINNYRSTINEFATGQMKKYQELNDTITNEIIRLAAAITAGEVDENGALLITYTDENGNVIETTHQALLKELEIKEMYSNYDSGCSENLIAMSRFMEGTGEIRGDNYVVYYDSGGVLTVGHGITLKWNSDKFLKYGIDVSTLGAGSEVSIEIMDKIELEILSETRQSVINTLKNNDISLTDYQIDALTLRHYNTGNINGFAENYKKYGNTQELYDNYMRCPTTDSAGNYLSGLENRRNTEWELFSNGNYTYE